MRSKFCILLLCGLLPACLPNFLEKYRSGSYGSSNGSMRHATSQNSQVVEQDLINPEATVASPGAVSSQVRTASPQPQASIYAIDKQVFRFRLSYDDVWNSALNVLMRNYNLTIVDKSNGLVTTEWDSFYLNNAVLRNRLSLRLVRSSRNTVDVMLHNNVERLRDASQATSSVGAVWLPAEDEANEIPRVIKNMALLLNQPPPHFPHQQEIATGGSFQEAPITR